MSFILHYQLIGSQHITFSNIGAESILQGHHLLFSEKGVCEIRGVSTCILLDVRYDHHTLPTSVPKTFQQYLFDEVHVSASGEIRDGQSADEVRQVYREFSTLVKKCLEISYNSITALLKRIRTEFLLPGESMEDDYIPELYPLFVLISGIP